VGKIAEKAVRRSVFFDNIALYLSAKLTKMHSFRLLFGDFAYWDKLDVYHEVTNRRKQHENIESQTK